MRTIFGALALLCGLAYADGVPLVSPAPALTASAVARISANHPARTITPVTVNRHAIESRIITVNLGGKSYRFIGEKSGLYEDVAWEGKTPEGDRARIERSENGLFGDFLAGGKRYRLVREGSFVVLELAPPQARGNYDNPTPQEIETMRRNHEARRKGIKP